MNVEEMIREGFALYSAGRAAEAARVCEAVLARVPSADAMHLLAILHLESGGLEAATEWASRAIEAAPSVAGLRNTRGVIYERAGRLDLAAEEYAAALAILPGQVRTLNNLGTALQRLGRNAQSLAVFRQAVAIVPGDVGTRYNLGTALQAMEERPEAAACYEAVLGVEPGHLGALVNLGILCQETNDLPAAEAYQRRALTVAPENFEATFGLGVTLRRLGQMDEAARRLETAARAPPDSEKALVALAGVWRETGRVNEAIALYRRAVELEPGSVEAWTNLSGALVSTQEMAGAGAAALEALRRKPDCAEAMANLAAAYVAAGRVEEAIGLSRRALAITPDATTAHSNLLLSLQYVPGMEPGTLFEEHLEWGRRHGAVGKVGLPFARESKERLRVGYLSADFCRHPVASFVGPILAGHDRSAVEVCCYADERKRDDVTAKLRGMADRWTAITGMSDAAVAELVRRDGVDVLVDLAGHTQGNRLGVLARRAVPVQVTYLGYCGTTGLSEVDYRVTDVMADPPGEERYYTERLARLAGCFCCYRPAVETPEVSALPARRNGYVTFGSLHALAKVNDAVLDRWAAVMRAVPGSRLLMYRDTIGAEERARLGAALVARRIEASRFELRGKTSEQSHLLTYSEIDVALDVFPFSGHTTVCEALWMGVPTVTLMGERHAGRMVGSVLHAAGCGTWVAGTADEYVGIAARLARDVAELAMVRTTLRERVAASRLCDARAFCAELEGVYRRMHQARSGGPVS